MTFPSSSPFAIPVSSLGARVIRCQRGHCWLGARARHLLGFFAAILVALFLFSAPAAGQAADIGIVTGNANLRAGPGTTYAIVGAVAKGKLVSIAGQDSSGGWYHLDSGQWIAATLVATDATPPISMATVSADPVGTATPVAVDRRAVSAKRAANLRAGPGTNFAVVGTVVAGQPLTVTGQNVAGDWLQLSDEHWIAAFLVDHATDAAAETAAPTPVAPPTVDATPTAAGSGNHFVLVAKRLWDPYENGGSLDGPSVHCGDGRELVVNVLDANGSRINGVAVQAQYGAREIIVTGAQGKGDGVAGVVLGGGQDVKVVRDNDGSPVSSDLASGLSTNPQAIPHDILIAGQYCQDEATCRHFAENNGCLGHFSWTVTFQRQN